MSDPQSVTSDPRPSMLVGGAPKKPALPKCIADEPTVTMIFPHTISLNLDNYMGLVTFEEGIQEVPISLKDHWYVVQQGAKLYQKAAVDPAVLAKQLEKAGYQVTAPAEPEKEEEEIPVVESNEPKGGKRASASRKS